MPGLIDLKTDLRSLSYGSGRGEPYIKTPLPAYDDNPGNPYLGSDMFGRSGQLGRSLTDVERLTKYLTNGKGLLFNAKQIALDRTRPKVPYGPRRNFLFSTVLAQAGVQGTGIHYDRAADLIVSNSQKYEYRTKTLYNAPLTNRLDLLYRSKISKQPVPSRNLFSITGVADQTTLLSYGGGPSSLGGIGKTTSLRFTNTTGYKPGIGFGKHASTFVLTNEQIGFRTRSRTTGFNSEAGLRNFVLDVAGLNTAPAKRIVGRRTNYTDFNRVKTYGVGEYSPNVDKVAYYESTPNAKLPGVDKINIKKLYSSAESFNPQDDLIKFYIGVVDNNDPAKRTYIQFRAYITGLTDNYGAAWNEVEYPGRGEKFFKYGGFTRDIGFGFKVHVGSRAELFPMYNKLNYLASIMAPDYSNPGFMRGNIVTLTVGDWINETYGIITGLSYSVPDDATWDIARKDDGFVDPDSAELPTIIDVNSFSFKPIHNFVPRTIRNLDDPESKFISLGSDAKGYGADKRGL